MTSKASKPSLRAPYYHRKAASIGTPQSLSFLPSNKGMSSSNLATSESVERAWPTSPRPDILLKSLRIEGRVTASDMAVWEICLAGARDVTATDNETASDRVARALSRKRFQISCDAIYSVLGWDRKSRFLLKSLTRLTNAQVRIDLDPRVRRRLSISDCGAEPMLRYEITDVDGVDVIQFEIPESVRQLLIRPSRYRQVELATLARMNSRYSISIYQQLLLKGWSTQVDARPGGTTFLKDHYAAFRPADLARRIGWLKEGDSFVFGAFKREVLDRVEEDLKHVRAFDIAMSFQREGGRGRSVKYVEFTLSPRTPDWRSLKTPIWDKSKVLQLAQPDVKERNVRAAAYLRAEAWFGVPASTLRQAWLLALYEADSSTPYNEGFDTRNYRGSRLLAALKVGNPNDVFWAFVDDELKTPSLTVGGYWQEDGEQIEQSRIRAVLREYGDRRSAVRDRLEQLVRQHQERQLSHTDSIIVGMAPGADKSDIIRRLGELPRDEYASGRYVAIVDSDGQAEITEIVLYAGHDAIVEARSVAGVQYADFVTEPVAEVVRIYEGKRAAKALLNRIGDGPIEPHLHSVFETLDDVDFHCGHRLFREVERAQMCGLDVTVAHQILLAALRGRADEWPSDVARKLMPAFDQLDTFYRQLDMHRTAA